MGGNIVGEKQGTFDIGEVKSLVFGYVLARFTSLQCTIKK